MKLERIYRASVTVKMDSISISLRILRVHAKLRALVAGHPWYTGGVAVGECNLLLRVSKIEANGRIIFAKRGLNPIPSGCRHDGQYFALSVLLVITDQFSTETAP
jgi:hypothetical protein